MKSICVKFFLALQISIGFSSAVAAQNLQIDWEIVGRYRLIKDTVSETRLFNIANLATNLQCAVDPGKSCKEKTHSEILSEFDKNIDPEPKNRRAVFNIMPDTFYNPVSGSYDKDYVKYPNHWVIKFKISDKTLETKKCNWYLDGLALSGKGNCQSFQFDTAISAGQIVRVETNDDRAGTITVKPTDILVVGMGDSYASGEGVPDVPAVTGVSPALWFDEKCHLSLLSAQSLTAARLAANNKHRSVTFVSRACSGARIIDVVDLPQTDPPHKRLGRVASLCYGGSHNTDCASSESRILPAQLTAIKNDLKHADKGEREPDLVLLSISGNDFGFADAIMDLLKTDVVPGKDKPFDLAAPYVEKAKKAREKVWGNYPILAAKLTNSYSGFPNATIVQTGYPNPLMRDGKNGKFCFDEKDNKNETYFQISEQKGIVGNFVDSILNNARFKGSQNEYIALHDDFLKLLTGNVSCLANLPGSPYKETCTKDKAHKFGLRQAMIATSCALKHNRRDRLENSEGLQAMYADPLCNNLKIGNVGFDDFSEFTDENKWRFSLARNELTSNKQLPNFVVNGFCLNDTHKGVQGRWFNVLGDAFTNLSSTGDILGFFAGAHTGTAHPNIYGQLFLAERAWVAIPQKFKTSK